MLPARTAGASLRLELALRFWMWQRAAGPRGVQEVLTFCWKLSEAFLDRAESKESCGACKLLSTDAFALFFLLFLCMLLCHPLPLPFSALLLLFLSRLLCFLYNVLFMQHCSSCRRAAYQSLLCSFMLSLDIQSQFSPFCSPFMLFFLWSLQPPHLYILHPPFYSY